MQFGFHGTPTEASASVRSSSSRTAPPLPVPMLLLLFGAAILLRFVLFLAVRYTVDDALITFRYAENLAAGAGFVYNAGEHVLGTTSPLLAVLLAALSWLRLTSFWSAFLMAVLSDVFIAWALVQFFRDRPALFGWLPAVVFLVGPESLQWCLSGLETELSIALLFASLLLASRGRWTSAFAVSALSVLTRVDGLAVPGALLLQYVLLNRKLPWKGIAVAALVLLPWFLFAVHTFGSPVPNSAAAKFALAESRSAGAYAAAVASVLLKGFLHLHTYGLPLLLLASIGVIDVCRNRRNWLALVLWMCGYALSYSLAAGPMYPWYYAPFYAGYLALAFLGLSLLLDRMHATHPARAAVAISVIAIVCFLSYYRVEDMRADQSRMRSVNREVGLWLRAHTSPGAVAAVKDIGYIGYYSHRRILDIAGLVSPECISFRSRDDFLGPIRTFRPEYFAFSEGQVRNLGLENSRLMETYGRVAVIGSYRIYGRKDIQ